MAVNSDNAGLASSLTDLMTSLAVIFILLLVASHNNERGRTGTIRTEILVALQQALESFATQGVGRNLTPVILSVYSS